MAQVRKIKFTNIKLAQCSCVRAVRNELQNKTKKNAPSLGRNKFCKIMNENKCKSCHSSSGNIILIEDSTVQ